MITEVFKYFKYFYGTYTCKEYFKYFSASIHTCTLNTFKKYFTQHCTLAASIAESVM